MEISQENEINVNSDLHDSGLNHEEEKKEKEVSSSFIDNKVLRMMKMMGYKSGLGLGKNQQGIMLPIQVEQQFDKRGLGFQVANFEMTTKLWNFSLEDTVVKENLKWLQNRTDLQIGIDEIEKWPREDTPKNKIEDECNFCDKEILQKVIEGKNIFDELDLKDLCQARARANPFETIRSVFFMNRAALKMANIDAVTDFMFTNIDRNLHHKDDLGPYYFADVCAGPGGFTEYILWRKKWLFKGFGLTLRDENDFKITDSICASPVTFLPLYGAKGDGDVCCPDNINDFREKVLHETDNKGVHFMMSDGGFSVEGNENIQEILSKNIYICQCLVALEILRKHGHFVTKIFDVFTSFSVGLLYLMYKCFEKVCILKPNSSRPANSERYFIGYDFKGVNAHSIKIYLRHLVNRLWELKDNHELDIIEIVPLNIIKNDAEFYSYICNSNNRIAKYQIIHLQKLATFCRNSSLTDFRQEELRKKCLEYWQIPDKPKLPLSKFTVEDLLSVAIDKRELLLVQPREHNRTDNLNNFLHNLTEWHYVPMQCRRNTNICNFYAGVGLSKVYRLQCNKWVRVKNLQLPRGTLLYGELVKEKCVYSNKLSNPETQHLKYSLHVIDALRLGDLSLADLKFDERKQLIGTFCHAVNHEFRTNSIRIRQKTINTLESLSTNNHLRKNEDNGNYIYPLPVLGYKVVEEFYDVNSILLLKTDQYQSFHSTYVLRVQLFINEEEQYSEKYIPLQTLIDFVKEKLI